MSCASTSACGRSERRVKVVKAFPAASAAPRIPSQSSALSQSEDTNPIGGRAQKHGSQRRTIVTKATGAGPAVATARVPVSTTYSVTSPKSVIMFTEANLNLIITRWNVLC